MKVLIAYDGSTCAKGALADLARSGLPDKGKILLLTLADIFLPPQPPGAEPALHSPYTRQLADMARSRVETLLAEMHAVADDAARRIRAVLPGWRVEKRVQADAPAWGILKEADAWKPDLIVVGSHGRGSFGRMALGSVSHKVLTHARCSVRISRGPQEPTDFPLRLILAVDGSRDSLAAAKRVARRNWPPETSARVIAVVNSDLRLAMALSKRAKGWIRKGDKEDKDWLERMVESMAGLLRGKMQHVGAEVRAGDPRQVLLHEAKAWGADCVFLGTRGLSGIERIFLGSVSLALAMHAPCSVEVAR